MQCVRARELQLMNQTSLSQSLPGVPFILPPVNNIVQADMVDQQVDGLASAMTDMCMDEDSPESYTMTADPYCQAQKRSDPVYMGNSAPLLLHHQEQQMLQQQLLLQQQQWIQQQQQLEQQQLAKNQEIQQRLQQTAIQPAPLVMDPPFKCEIGRGRILKRADLIPMQECPM